MNRTPEINAHLLTKIDEVLEHFNWEKVSVVMRATNWKWGEADGFITPTFSMMRETARELLTKVITENKSAIATGGFKATAYDNGIELEFIVTSCDYETPENQP